MVNRLNVVVVAMIKREIKKMATKEKCAEELHVDAVDHVVEVVFRVYFLAKPKIN